MITTDAKQVISQPAVCHCGAIHVHHVHHRDFPEIWAECTTPLEGAERLVNLLVGAREASRGPWHRETIDQAIADVNAFVEAGRREAAARQPLGGPLCIRTSANPECPLALADRNNPGHC